MDKKVKERRRMRWNPDVDLDLFFSPFCSVYQISGWVVWAVVTMWELLERAIKHLEIRGQDSLRWCRTASFSAFLDHHVPLTEEGLLDLENLFWFESLAEFGKQTGLLFSSLFF